MSKKFSEHTDMELIYLLKGAKPDQEGAFAEIYSRYSNRVYAYCIKVLGSQDEANDVFQETFLKLIATKDISVEISSLSWYLITIARNLCLNSKRRKKDLIDFSEVNFSSNDVNYENKELLDLIEKALDMLEFHEKEIFVLRQYQGISYEEIALIIKDTVGNARNKFWRAKEKLKAILAPYTRDIENTFKN
ncbi:MAG: RNA polymerase sigma factor [Candidatus Kapabacteria bacterium]|jgi:RNA polymerase sigma-70 factor (ECF subfamily)|nr:RNA polymerase sigma factor [Candidatus Kapabacteria bacterium]